MAKFISVDGEADKSGRYIILCDSTGRVLYDPTGISTSDALQFIVSLPKGFEIVCFGLNYDANQWMRDLPRNNLERIASGEHRTTWRGEWKLEWIPSKMFTVSVPGKSVTVCEVFGFFQTSFVKALKQWGFDTPQEIETMKQKRGTFTQAELQRITAYCLAECRLLVQLMERLQDACKIANCVPRRRWIGAGSIASSLLIREGVKTHHAYDVDIYDESGVEYVLRAYFGGRVELYSQGWTTNALVEDVRSAYPFGATKLPSLEAAEAVRLRNYDPTETFALYRCVWDCKPTVRVAPFPVRLQTGQICYPLKGEGVYHAHEVKVAMGLPDVRVRVLDGIALHVASDARPFDWIPGVYEHRRMFKRSGNYAEKALKLGLNSVYGKTAQGYGFGRKPPFQNYYWAGFITSYTRARVLERLSRAQYPVMCATDGIVTRRPANGAFSTPTDDENDDLGTWERSTYSRIATIQPGVYVAEVDGERIVKSRGFFARDVNYDDLVSQFHKDPRSCYHFDSRRFIGLKVALHRKDFGVWRQWVDERRSIAFEINHKESVIQDDGSVLLYPPVGPYTSLAYVPKQSLYDDPTDDQLENVIRDDQPHREVD